MDFVLNRNLEGSSLIYVDLITAKSSGELRKILNNISSREKLIVVDGLNDEINRTALENRKADILVNTEFNNERDFIHFRNSGLNQVLCKLAKKNNIAIGFNFSELMNSNKKELYLGRMMQNVFLCRKYKLKMVLGSFAKKENELKNLNELKSFGRVIGMNGKEVNESLSFSKKEEKIKILK